MRSKHRISVWICAGLIISLTAAAPGAAWIDVPFVSQDKNGCGAAVISMVLQYWAGKGYAVAEGEMDPHRILKQLYSPEARGIFASDLVRYFSRLGYHVFEVGGTIGDLQEHIAKGRPVIVALGADQPLHYLVVVGVDSEESLILVNDPAQKKMLKMHQAEFEEGWKHHDNWMLLAVPSATAAPDTSTVGPGDPDRMQKKKDIESLLNQAGGEFRKRNYQKAKALAQKALERDPDNSYAHDFLGTVFFLEGNLEAALLYWNRIGKPHVQRVRVEPVPRLDPVLLDRTFAFSPSDALELEELLATESRLDSLDIFRRFRFDLIPHPETGTFDLVFRPLEKKGTDTSRLKLGSMAIQAFLTQTIRPEFYNLGGSAVNSDALFSWDPDQRRVYSSLSFPLNSMPEFRFQVEVDWRREEWAFPLSPAAFGLQRWETGGGFRHILNSRTEWDGKIGFSHRRYLNAPGNDLFQDGRLLKVGVGLSRILIRRPQDRFILSSHVSAAAGRFSGTPSNVFGTLEQQVEARWCLTPGGNDQLLRLGFRMGTTLGDAPLDEYFVLGVDRDTELLLRAHNGLDGKKGRNPMGRDYLLWNLDWRKEILDAGWFGWSLTPFLDVARIGNEPITDGNRWLLDTGIQSGFRILGSASLSLTYGKDLRTGANRIYFSFDY